MSQFLDLWYLIVAIGIAWLVSTTVLIALVIDTRRKQAKILPRVWQVTRALGRDLDDFKARVEPDRKTLAHPKHSEGIWKL